MSETEDKKSSGAWAQLISEIVAFIPKDLRELIGFMGGMYLLISMPILIFGGVKLVQKNIDKPQEPTAQCWQIQKLNDQLFKLNTCTGETIEITQQTTSPQPSKAISK